MVDCQQHSHAPLRTRLPLRDRAPASLKGSFQGCPLPPRLAAWNRHQMRFSSSLTRPMCSAMAQPINGCLYVGLHQQPPALQTIAWFRHRLHHRDAMLAMTYVQRVGILLSFRASCCRRGRGPSERERAAAPPRDPPSQAFMVPTTQASLAYSSVSTTSSTFGA